MEEYNPIGVGYPTGEVIKETLQPSLIEIEKDITKKEFEPKLEYLVKGRMLSGVCQQSCRSPCQSPCSPPIPRPCTPC